MKPYVVEILSEKSLSEHGLLNIRTVRRLVDAHFSGIANYAKIIWCLVMFQKWYDVTMKQDAKADIAAVSVDSGPRN